MVMRVRSVGNQVGWVATPVTLAGIKPKAVTSAYPDCAGVSAWKMNTSTLAAIRARVTTGSFGSTTSPIWRMSAGWSQALFCFRCYAIGRYAYSSASGPSRPSAERGRFIAHSVRRSINVDMPMARPLASARP